MLSKTNNKDSNSPYSTQYNNKQNLHSTNTLKGVLMTNYIKNNTEDDCFKSYITIPKDAEMPQELYETEEKKQKDNHKKVLPLVLTPLLLLAAGAAFTKVCHHSYKSDLKLPDIARNVNLNDERDFVTYAAIQNPSTKTIIGALSVFALSGSALILKNVIDGFKDIWVKRKEADIQKSLQERLIDVETRSFSGKYQILRTMIAQKAKQMDDILKMSGAKNRDSSFEAKFKGTEKAENPQKSTNWKTLALGAGTLAASAVLIAMMMKNIKMTGKEIEKYKQSFQKDVQKSLENFNAENATKAKENVINFFTLSGSKTSEMKEALEKTKFSNEDKTEIIDTVKQNLNVFADAPDFYGKKNKISFYSYINDVRGHLYNAIVNPSKLTTTLFLALAGQTAISYIGSKSVEAVKDVAVKKANADTEYDLHNRLVQIELQNFYKKKCSVVDPLMEEFRQYATQNPENKEELGKMYNHVLEEIKNGPPFVYS